MEIPKAELEKLSEFIKESIQQGVVGASGVSSNFWGVQTSFNKEQKEFNKRIETKLDVHINEHNAFYKKIEPIIQNYEDVQSTKRTLQPIGKNIMFIGGAVVAWQAIVTFFKNFFN